MPKLVLISDTHEKHDQVVVPECDILVHAGDLTLGGEVSVIREALTWLDKQPARFVVAIAGNHDFLFEEKPEIARDLLLRTRVQYLEDPGCEIMGLNFWGSPYTPRFFDWAFNVDRGEKIRAHWNKIPDNTNILITHGPPYGVLDRAQPRFGGNHLGCEELAKRIQQLNDLQLHVFGHIHGERGIDESVGLMYINASVVNEAYKVVNKPIEIEIPAPKSANVSR